MLMLTADRSILIALAATFGVLCAATLAGRAAERAAASEASRAVVRNANERIGAWWAMVALFGAALLLGKPGVVVFFAAVSWLALREFFALTRTAPADHRALLVVFYAVTPLQYALVWLGATPLYLTLIPAVACLLVPLASALGGETRGFLGRAATIQWGMVACVYAVSFAPALLDLAAADRPGHGTGLLLFLVAVVQGSDVLQYLWGKLLTRARGRRTPIAPRLSPNKTWEGFLGGIASAALLGAALAPLTPFEALPAAGLALLLALAGFAGGLVFSAIKRDHGVKDYGTLLPGHGGILDRIDSLIFAAPLLYLTVAWVMT